MRAWILLVPIALATISGIAQAQSSAGPQRPPPFQDWLGVCGSSGYCAATVHPAAGATDGDYVLRVGRHAQETYWEISLRTGAVTPDSRSDVTARLDARDAETLSTAAFGSLHDLYLLGTSAQKLMDRLVHGKSVSFAFRDTSDVERQVTFPLDGLAAALIWIDTQQHRIGAERVTGAPPYGLVPADLPGAAWMAPALIAVP
ncbi:MAG: DUF1176 domain-containing protein [Devosia sp.]|nr:DUF1176 domain-containing protein [Devosia sp.]